MNNEPRMTMRGMMPEGVIDCRRRRVAVWFCVAGKWKGPATWTGTKSYFLKVPFDGTAPSYITEAVFNDAVENGNPDDAEYYDLRATYGDQHLTGH